MMLLFKGRIHPSGWPFIGIAAAVSLFFWTFSTLMGCIGLILTAWCVYFFRDPERVLPLKENVLVSPADGIVQQITQAAPPKELNLGDEPWTRISIFLSVFDVHVNRIPVSGSIDLSAYHPGQFVNASFDKASDVNERHSLLITLPQGGQVICTQIAGLIARRILCQVEKGQRVQMGARYGIIRFGSRVDVYCSPTYPIHVQVGQRMIGGETILADIIS